jgi:hypothetical protein
VILSYNLQRLLKWKEFDGSFQTLVLVGQHMCEIP